MSQGYSITLYLDGNGENWSWHIMVTINDGREPSATIPFTKKVLPTELHKRFIDQIDLIDPIRTRSIGIDLFKSIFPPEIAEVLKNAAHADRSDIYFKIPPEWADIPFDLCYLPQKGFLGQIFRIGTTIRTETVNPGGKETPPKNKMLIIIDATEKARQEAGELKEKAKENGWDVHLISEGNTSKILQEMERSSVVHYAGHAIDNGSGHAVGWKLGSGQVLDIANLGKLMTCHSIPQLIFSNSCHSGNYRNGCNLSGIAGTFLKVGVLQVIGPVWEVNDDEAKELALLFYQHFFKGNSPSESLLAAKQGMGEQNRNTTPLLYRLFGDPLYNPLKLPQN